jgi:hypothetical protein
MMIANPDKDPDPFTPETLAACVKAVEALRNQYLFDIDEAGADPVAEQHYLTALATLEVARQHFALARLFQTRALARKD